MMGFGYLAIASAVGSLISEQGMASIARDADAARMRHQQNEFDFWRNLPPLLGCAYCGRHHHAVNCTGCGAPQ